MFDVIWTDHSRELVGERRARKELEKKDQDVKAKEESRSSGASVETRGSNSSGSGEKQKSFLGSLGFRKASTPSTPKKTANSSLRTPKDKLAAQRESLLAPTISTASSEDKSNSLLPLDGNYITKRISDQWVNSSEQSSRESVFTRWNDNSLSSPTTLLGSASIEAAPTPTPNTKVVQTLGADSFVTATREISVEPRKGSGADRSVSDVIITADKTLIKEPKNPSAGMPQREVIMRQTREWVSALKDPLPSPASARTSDAPDSRSSFLSPIPESPVAPSIPTRSQRRMLSRTRTPVKFNPNNTDLWRAPDDWASTPTSSTSVVSMEETMVEMGEMKDNAPSINLANLQQELKMMLAASPSNIWIRLREEWNCSGDATLYKDLEMAKKRWMLSALYTSVGSGQSTISQKLSKGQKILALHESQAMASYLAVSHVNQTVHHLACVPLSPILFPNIVPMPVPMVSTSGMTFAPNYFSAVYSLALPSVMPSSEIPPMLRKVAQYLQPGGALHLTLIDALPVESTLGPNMRAWLSENLLVSLERQFRCTKPNVLLPSWLAEAGLRGEGSTISTISFDAVPKEAVDAMACASPSMNSKDNKQELRVRLELRSLVGRMLWQEVWGSFVAADKWWWEVPDCVVECGRLGTSWQYSIIQAVKQPSAGTS